jgi:circadian clock protein KaiC
MARSKVISGIVGLDKMLNGGIPKSNQIIIAGGPGTGKTLLCLEYLYRGALSGETSILFSLEEETNLLVENMKEAFPKFTEIDRLIAEGKLIIKGVDQASSLIQKDKKGNIFTFTTTIEDIEETIVESGATKVAIDSISVMKLFVKDPYEYRGVSSSLVGMLRRQGITALLTMEIETSDKNRLMFEPEFFVYDGIVILYLSGGNEENRVPSIEVIKMRGTQHSFSTVPYEITPEGINLLLIPHKE